MSNWNGKVRCIEENDSYAFKIGEAYDVVNNIIRGEDGFKHYFENINRLNKELEAKFEEIFDDEYIEAKIKELKEKLENISVEISTLEDTVSVIKQPFYQYSEEEIITLKALWINDYEYIARDKDRDLCAWDRKPKQLEDEYDYGDADCFASLDYDLFKNVEFGTLLNISHELSKIN